MLEVFLSYHSVELGLCFPSCDYRGVVRMGTSSALICPVVPGSSGQEASSLRNLYIQGSDLLKCSFRLPWLLKVFNNGLVVFHEGARYQILLLLSSSEKLCCHLWYPSKTGISLKFYWIVMVLFSSFRFCWLHFSFCLGSEEGRVEGVKKQDRPWVCVEGPRSLNYSWAALKIKTHNLV